MLKKLTPHYIVYLLKILLKILTLFAGLILILFALKPFGITYTIAKLLCAGVFALFVKKQLNKTPFKNFLWAIENSNPHFQESLISYYELKKSKSPYLEILENRLREKMQRKLKIPTSPLPEIRFLLYSIIFALSAITLFPSLYSGFRKIPLGEIAPRFVLAYKDTTIVFRAPTKARFYMSDEHYKTLYLAKDTAVQIKFHSLGTYRVYGEFKGLKTLPSLVKIVEKPQIDSFVLIVGKKSYPNIKWIAIAEKAPIKLKVYANPDYKLNIFQNEKLIRSGGNSLELTLTPSNDVEIFAQVEYKNLKNKLHLTTLSVVPNLPPRIEILEPQALFSYVPEDMKLRISSRIFDEDGIEAAYLYYTLRGNIRRIKFIGQSQIERLLTYIIDLQKESMLPGDELKFYLIAEDKTGLIDSSQLYTIVFPTLEQTYKEELAKMEKVTAEFEKSTETFTTLKSKVSEIIDSLKIQSIKGEITVETDKILEELQNAIQQFSKIQEAIENLQSLSLSPELLQKLQKVGEELYSILQKDLPELLKKIETLSDSTSRFDSRKAEELTRKSDEILERLNYLEQLLELAKKELAINDAIDKIQKLLEKRENLRELAKSGDLSELKNLEKQFETEISEDFSHIRENLKDITSPKELDENLNKIQSLQVQILKALGNNNRKQTLKLQESQQEELKEMLSKMKNLKQSSIDQQISKLIEVIGSVRRKLLITSLELEDNLKNSEFLPYVMRALQRCKEEIRKAGILILVASSRVPKLLDLAIDSLYLKPSVSLNYINYAIFELFRMEAMSKSTAQSSGMEAMKMLEKLMKEQASMIRQTGEIMQIPIPIPQNFTSSMLEKLSEMKNQMISLYMQSSNQEVREKIEQALKELQKVEEKLKKREFDTELIETQRKTLKHLLEAYGTYKKEEYTQKRYAEPAKPYPFVKPGAEKTINPQKISEILKEIEKLPPQEKKIIREYYNRLLRL